MNPQRLEQITPEVSAPRDSALTLVNHLLLRLVLVLAVLGNILSALLRPYPYGPEMYVVEYWLCGVTLGVILLAISTRSLKANKSNVILISILIVAVAGLFINAQRHENIIKNHSGEQCQPIEQHAALNSLLDAGPLSAPSSESPSVCIK